MTPSQPDSSKLLSLAVHELRTPVNVSAGYLRMLLQFHSQALTEEQRKFVTEASQACGRLGDLLADLGALAKLMSGATPLTREVVPVFSLAAEVAGALAEGQDRGVKIEVRSADEAVLVTGDRAWLQTALRSLLAVIVREQLREGTVVVETRCTTAKRDRRALVVMGEESACAALASLPPGRWDSFDPWRGGVGFSVAIAAEVVAAHGGRLGTLAGATRRPVVAIALPITA